MSNYQNPESAKIEELLKKTSVVAITKPEEAVKDDTSTNHFCQDITKITERQDLKDELWSS